MADFAWKFNSDTSFKHIAMAQCKTVCYFHGKINAVLMFDISTMNEWLSLAAFKLFKVDIIRVYRLHAIYRWKLTSRKRE